MLTLPWLTALALLPIVGSLVTFACKGRTAKVVGAVFAGLTAIAGVVVFVAHTRGFDFGEDFVWIRAIGAHYALGMDGLAAVLVLLTVLVVPAVMAAEWHVGDKRDATPANDSAVVAPRWSTGVFFALALLLEGLALFVFLATDVLLFYIFFEATLIPMYFLIGGWGGPKRGKAALKFLLYSLFGGLVLLFGIVGVYAASAKIGHPTFLIENLQGMQFDQNTGRWLFAAFFIAFAIKAPMVPVHTWLPDTAEQATPGASTLLVGILDKIGTFGMLRFCLGLFPEASAWATPFVLVLALISIIYGALMAVGAKHLLRLVAYTSVSHFGFMVMGIFAMTTPAINGSIMYMLAHGFSTAMLFLAVGFLIQRRGSAYIADFGGIQKIVPAAAGLFLIAGLSALALPGMASFVGEFMVISGTWSRYPVHAAISTLGMVLAALYVLWAYQRVATGPINPDAQARITTDLDVRERSVLGSLLVLLLVFGFMPKPMLDVIEPSARATMTQVQMTDLEPASVEEGK